MLEWLWYLNSHAELLYQHMLGDKDTFEMAFMLAGKHTDFHRVRISPGVPLTRLYTDVYRGGWRDRFIHRVSLLFSTHTVMGSALCLYMLMTIVVGTG